MKNALMKFKMNIKSNRGSEILQVILIAGVLLVLIITIFYPQMKALLENIINKITNWFDSTGSSVFGA